MAPGLLRLEIRTDGHALVPERADWIEADRQVREVFGVEDPMVILIRSSHEEDIFNSDTLELVQALTDDLKKFPELNAYNIVSLATEKSHRVRPGTLIFRRFLEPMPCSSRELSQLRSDLQKIALYNGTLVSDDGRATAVLVGVPTGVSRTALYQKIVTLVAQIYATQDTLDVIGAPVAEALLGTHILEDLGVPRWLLGHQLADEPTPDKQNTTLAYYSVKRWIAQRIGLVPIAIMLMGVVFLISFKSVTATALPLMEVGACLVFVFGLMGYLQVPVYLTVAVLPVILTAIGIADEIHIFTRYRQILRSQPHLSTIEAVTETMQEMASPITKTSITTAVGFLSFALSPIRPVQMFGIFTAVGILFCWYWSLTVIPASLVLVGSKRILPKRKNQLQAVPALSSPSSAIHQGILGLRHLIMLLVMGVIIISYYGVQRVIVQDSWIDGFATQSRFHQATTYCNEHFMGTHTLLLRVDADSIPPIESELVEKDLDHHTVNLPLDIVKDPQDLVGCRLVLHREPIDRQPLPGEKNYRPLYPWNALITEVTYDQHHITVTTAKRSGSPRIAMRRRKTDNIRIEIKPEPLTRPELLRKIEAFEFALENHRAETVGGVLGPGSFLRTTNYMARGLQEGTREIPNNRERIRWLWLQYGKVRSDERLAQAVTKDFSSALIHVFMKNANFIDTARFIKQIREHEKELLTPYGLSLTLAGDVAVSQTLIDAIVSTQIRSLLGSLIGIFLITTLLGRSAWMGFLSVIPCALAVLVNFAVMGWLKIPLGVATSMFSGMTLGIGVDYAIHFLDRYRHARKQTGDTRSSILDALQSTGPAILIDALAVAIGFGVLILSQVPANARLGGLLVLSIASCLVATLLVLPAILMITHRNKTVSVKLHEFAS